MNRGFILALLAASCIAATFAVTPLWQSTGGTAVAADEGCSPNACPSAESCAPTESGCPSAGPDCGSSVTPAVRTAGPEVRLVSVQDAAPRGESCKDRCDGKCDEQCRGQCGDCCKDGRCEKCDEPCKEQCQNRCGGKDTRQGAVCGGPQRDNDRE